MVNNLEKSFGLCSLEEKNKFDHRMKAVNKLISYLKNNQAENKIEPLIHKTIKKVTEDIDNLKFNTAISQLMILANEMEKETEISITNFKLFLNLLSPFVPHITEELWETLKEKQSIHLQSWPKFNPELVIDSEITMVIQVNGKVRDQIKVPVEISEDDAKKLALRSDKLKKWIEGKEIRKVIFIKERLINIVV
ncbi:MAG: class I tRNA ligase family protein [Candidatus Pacebacteria bacterium]|nr:class I tRNA ligase family protein [Candidatus Paceibacterota bacterium]